MVETKEHEIASIGTAKPKPLIGDRAIGRDGGCVVGSETETITQREIIETMIEAFSGYEIIGKCVGMNKSKAYRYIKGDLGLNTLREFDTLLEKTKLIYNIDYPRHLLTHAMDFYRLSNGSLQRKHHKRANVQFEGNSILLGMITNLQTGKVYFTTWLDEDETELKAIQLIEKVMDSPHENITAIQTDRYLKDLTADCERLGITVATYGKSVKHPYNSKAEQPFTNISKQFYLMMGMGYGVITKAYNKFTPKEQIAEYRKMLAVNQFGGLTQSEALQLFNSILEIHYNNDGKPLVRIKRQLKAKRLELIAQQQIKEPSK